MLKEQGNIITENIPITKELLDFALANNYKISLKTGDYSKDDLKINRARNHPNLIHQVGVLYLEGSLYPVKYFIIFGFKNSGCFRATLKQHLRDLWIDSRVLYKEDVNTTYRNNSMMKYGVDNPSKLPEIRERVKETYKIRFGVDNPSKSCEVKARIRETNLKRYGSKTPIENAIIKAKIQETNQNRYGCVSPFSNDEVKLKIKQTNLKRYGSEHNWSSKILKAKKSPRLSKVYEFQDYLNAHSIDSSSIDSSSIIDFITGSFCKSQALIHLKSLNIKNNTNHSTELNMRGILSNLGCNLLHYSSNPNKFKNCNPLDFVQNAKKLHQVRFNRLYHDLDFYFPDLKLGIEVNGLQNHSVNAKAMGRGEPKTKDYHFRKFQAFHKSGILMLSFTDYELYKFKDDVVNIIKYHLKLSEDIHVSEEFLKFNEIESLNKSLNYGLFDRDHLSEDFENHQHQRFIGKFEYWDCGVVKS